MYWKSICDALKVSLALITSAPPTVLGGRDCGEGGQIQKKNGKKSTKILYMKVKTTSNTG